MAKPKDLELRLERAEMELRLVQRLSRILVSDIPVDLALSKIVSLVVEYLRCDSCLIYRLEDAELVLCASNRHDAAAMGSVRLRLNEGLTGWVARERRLLAIFREAYRDPRFKAFSNLPEDTFEAFLSAPLLARSGVVGVINVQHREPHTHTGVEMELLTTVGELTGTLIELARGSGEGRELSLTATPPLTN